VTENRIDLPKPSQNRVAESASRSERITAIEMPRHVRPLFILDASWTLAHPMLPQSSIRAHAEDAHWIEACLKFRQAVAEEFERLLCAGTAVMDLPEVDDGELDTIEQGSAAA